MSQIHELDTFYSNTENQFPEPGINLWKRENAVMEHCELYAKPEPDAIPGQVAGFASAEAQKTHLQQIDPELQDSEFRESERLFATLAELSPVGIFRIEANGRCVYINQRWREISGLRQGDPFHQNWIECLHPDDRERVLLELQEAMSVEQSFYTECRFLHPDGKVVWVIGQALPERLKSGELIGYIGTITDITDRKRVEQALQESEQRYANLSRMSPVGIFKTDRKGDILYANERWTEIAGLTSEESRGSGWRRSVHPTDRDRVTADWYRYVRACLPFQAEFRFQRPNGSITWVMCQAVPEVLDTDEMVGYVGTITDISDRKQAEQDLEESEHRYATLSRISPVGIFRMDAEGHNTYVNDRWREFTGLSRYEGMGKQWQEAIHPDDRPAVAEIWQQMAVSPAPLEIEYRYLRPDGKVTWVVCQAVPEFRENGKLVGYVGTVTDISDRKHSEEAIQASERRYAALAEIAPVGIFRCDPVGACLYINERWCDIAGLTEAQSLGWGWMDSVHPDDRDRTFLAAAQVAKVGLPFHAEFRFLRPDQSITWVLAQAVAETDQTGRITGYVGSVTDITDRKQTEMELETRAAEMAQVNLLLTRATTLLEERNRELDQFAYVASHDLKAPLRAIANLSEWIEEDLQGLLPPDNQRQMQLLRGRVHRMEELINGLLQYSRVGRTQVSTETVEVKTLLHEVIDSLAPPPSFTVAITSEMPTLTTKALLLRQVFSNLIGNAIKHHPQIDGQVSISVEDLGTAYEFTVADNGRGIAPEHHEKIFAIFQTLESRDTKESTGIGLSIVKKIVDTEGGSIRVESHLGSGTTFRFTWLKRSK